MPLGQTNCILCPTEPPPPLTGEHIWPGWYSRRHQDQRYEMETILGSAGTPNYEMREGLDLKPEVLCADCNNRWGSTFENRVRPDILPMSEGQSREITLKAARRLAAWAALKAMVAEHLVEAERGYTFYQQDHRVQLRKTAHPPDCVRGVWIGRYVGARRNAGWLMDRIGIVPFSTDPAAEAILYVQTLAIGQLAFQTLAFYAYALDPTEQRNTVQGFFPVAPGDWSTSLIPIWPLPERPVNWPPQAAFDDDGFQDLARRWHEHGPPGQAENDPTP